MPEQREDLPDWFWRYSPLTMNALKGPDDQYRAGARDMLALILGEHTPFSQPAPVHREEGKPDDA